MRINTIIVLLITVCLTFSSSVQAKKQKGPYEATVEKNGAFIRSGPGKKYYPTMQLKRGTRVTVYRHDPGGWYMIAPPKNSFSWVNAKYVKLLKKNLGEITTNRVTVNVGTAFGDTKDVWQRTLSTGDRIQIIGEKLLQSSKQKIKYYKIAPPRGEWRWIRGRAVIPVNNVASREIDPFEDPPGIKRPKKKQEEYDEELSFKEDKKYPDVKGVNQNGPNQELLAKQNAHLKNLDSAFGKMIQKETGEWNFSELSNQYHQLQKEATSIALTNKIKLRFDALNKYGKIKKQYDNFLQLTRETTIKEARLLDLQNNQLNGSTISGEPVPLPENEIVPETETIQETETPVENNEILEEQSSVPAFPNPLNGPVLQGPSMSQVPRDEFPESPETMTNQTISATSTTNVGSSVQRLPAGYPTPQGSVPQQFHSTQNGVPVQQPANMQQYSHQPTQGRTTPNSRRMVGVPQYQPAPGLLGKLGLIPPRRIFVNQPQQVSSNPPQQAQPNQQHGQIQSQLNSYPNQIQPIPHTQPMQQKAAYSPASEKSQHALLDGAGIVQRTPSWRQGSPRYVLTNQKGKILAYIQGNNGMNLEQHIGHAVGVQGNRSHRQDLQTDFIQVNHLTPVHLK